MKFQIGDYVRKIKGSEWSGYIVGYYNTEQTRYGYCVESEHHKNTVQIYPEEALELII